MNDQIKPKKKFRDTRFWKFTKNLVLDTAEVLIPVVGPTFVKSIKENTPHNPKGKMKFSRGKWYKLALGLSAAWYIYLQIKSGQPIDADQIEPIIEIINEAIVKGADTLQ